MEKLLQAARSLFVSKGYRATTLEQIATAAGLTKGAVYFHFGSKEAVVLQLLDLVQIEVILPVVDILEKGPGSMLDRLIRFMHVHAEMGLTRRDDLLLLISMSVEFAEQKGEAAARIKQIYQLFNKPLKLLIKRGQTQGEIRKDAPAAELAAIVIAVHDGAFLEWYRRGTELDGRHLVRTLRTVLLHGIGEFGTKSARTARR